MLVGGLGELSSRSVTERARSQELVADLSNAQDELDEEICKAAARVDAWHTVLPGFRAPVKPNSANLRCIL